MSYAAEYVNLLNRLAESRGRRLSDVARIGGMAQMANAQVWGQLPGQIVDIAGGAYNQYQKSKELEQKKRQQEQTFVLQNRKAELDDARFEETTRRNQVTDARLADTAAEDLKFKQQGRELDEAKALLPGVLSASRDLLAAAATGRDAYRERVEDLRFVNRTMHGLSGKTFPLVELPDDPNDVEYAEIVDGISTILSQYDKARAMQKPNLMTVTPGTVVLDEADPTKPLFTAPTAQPRPVAVQTSEGGKNVTRFVAPIEGTSLPAPIPRPVAGASGTGAAEVDVLPPDPLSQDILSQTGLSLNAFRSLTGQASQLPRDRDTRNKAAAEAQAFARRTGTDVSTMASQYKTYNDVLGANISRMNNTKIMENELLGTLDNLQKVVADKDLSKLRFANVAKIWAGQEVNDDLAQQYALHLGQLRNELSAYYAATQGRTGNNIMLADQRDAELVIRNGVSKGSLDGLTTAVKNSTAKMGVVMEGSVKRAQKAVWSLFGVGQNYQDKDGASKAEFIGVANDGRRVRYSSKADLDADVRDGLVTPETSSNTSKTTGAWGSNPFKKR